MPNADWKKCAVWTALPTTQTRESQPDTGNGSVEASYSTRPTSCSSWCEVEVGEALLVVEGLLEAHAPHWTPDGAGCASSAGGPGRSARSGYRSGQFCCAGCIVAAWSRSGRWTPWTSRCSRRCASTRAPGPWSSRASPASPAPRSPPGCSGWRTAASSPATGRTSTSSAAGFGVQAFVTLEIAQGAIEDVQRDLEAIPGLLEAHATTGSGDVLCRVAASSHEALQQVLVDLNRSPAVVRSTSVVALSHAGAVPHAAAAGVARPRPAPAGRPCRCSPDARLAQDGDHNTAVAPPAGSIRSTDTAGGVPAVGTIPPMGRASEVTSWT